MSTLTWQIAALKYDYRPHYTWPADFIDDDGEQIRFSTVIGGTLIHYTRAFEQLQRCPSDLTFWRSQWYNVFTNYDSDHTLHNFYCNVAMPLVIESNTLKYVDLDLDVRIYPDGTYNVLDEDEFIAHAEQFAYPAWLQKRARSAVDEIIALAQARTGPFELIH